MWSQSIGELPCLHGDLASSSFPPDLTLRRLDNLESWKSILTVSQKPCALIDIAEMANFLVFKITTCV